MWIILHVHLLALPIQFGNLLLRTKNNPLKRVRLDIRRHSIDTWRAWWTHRSLNLRFPPPSLFQRARGHLLGRYASAQFAIGAWTGFRPMLLAPVSLYAVDFLSLLATVLLQGRVRIPLGPAYWVARQPRERAFRSALGSLSRLFPFPRYKVDKNLLRGRESHRSTIRLLLRQS